MPEKDFEAKVNWCTDYLEICQLQSKYAHYLHMCMYDSIPTCFAEKTEGIEIEIDGGGVNEGMDAPRRVFFERMGQGKKGPSPFFPGWIVLHMAVNPVIEINKDGTRAKGLWHSPGLWTKLIDDELVPCWIYGKYVMEYVKEDGEWKFLKLNYRQTFDTPYEKGWVKHPSFPAGDPMERPPERRPNRPPTYHRPYDPNALNIFEPPPPEPYDD
ncbi:nuclear transport factor 2 family protein [Thermodesulfobacteriota bacterium]